MPAELEGGAGTRPLPHLDGTVAPAAHDPATVGAERDVVDVILVSPEDLDLPLP
jgi:hypothetical protein